MFMSSRDITLTLIHYSLATKALFCYLNKRLGVSCLFELECTNTLPLPISNVTTAGYFLFFIS